MSIERFQLNIVNYYGRLEVLRIEGEYFVELDNYSKPTKRPITEALARMLCAELPPAADVWCSGQDPMFTEAITSVRVVDGPESAEAKLVRLSAMWTEDNQNAGQKIREARGMVEHRDGTIAKLKNLLAIVLDDEVVGRMEAHEIEELVESTREASDGE